MCRVTTHHACVSGANTGKSIIPGSIILCTCAHMGYPMEVVTFIHIVCTIRSFNGMEIAVKTWISPFKGTKLLLYGKDLVCRSLNLTVGRLLILEDGENCGLADFRI